MRVPVSDRTILGDFCERFCAVLDKHAKYVIVSGFMVIALGRPRGTEDIDMLVELLSRDAFIKLHEDLVKNGFVCMQAETATEAYDDYLALHLSVRYTLENEPLPEMEVKLVKDTLDLWQVQQRVKIPETHLDVWFTTPEANIAFKEEFLKSDKDMEDARFMRKLFADKISENAIAEVKNLIKTYKLGGAREQG